MKLEPPVNPNYCATVVRVKNLVPLANADRLMGIPMFGYQAITDLSTEVGRLGLLFPAEVQLSEEYARANDLFRHSEKNFDTDKVGYLEDNRRVRAIKLRGNRSDALFMPLSSLIAMMIVYDGAHSNSWFDFMEGLKEGDSFDKVGDFEICRKYQVPVKHQRGLQAQLPTKSRVEKLHMPEHFDSENFFRIVDRLDPFAPVVVTQKLHGTSIRIGNTIVKRRLSWRERLARRLGVKVQETEFDSVYGSRKVIKDVNNPDQNHYYEYDIWTEEGKKLDGLIPKNYIVYGELIGWTKDGSPIQKHYTYDCLPGTCKLYVYRVAFVNEDGVVADLSWDALKEFCQAAGLNAVPELDRGLLLDFRPEDYMDRKFYVHFAGTEVEQVAVPLAEDSPCDEGVCIRIEGMIPQIYKAKSPMFLQHETALLDKGDVDLESAETAPIDDAVRAAEEAWENTRVNMG